MQISWLATAALVRINDWGWWEEKTRKKAV
jgi:hypothetical protein